MNIMDSWIPKSHSHSLHKILDKGYKSNNLTVLTYLGSNKLNKRIYKCKCVCGKTSLVVGSALIHKRILGCWDCGRRSSAKKSPETLRVNYFLRNKKTLEHILTLRCEYTYKEISHITGIPDRTIGFICQRCGMYGYTIRKRGAPGVRRKIGGLTNE